MSCSIQSLWLPPQTAARVVVIRWAGQRIMWWWRCAPPIRSVRSGRPGLPISTRVPSPASLVCARSWRWASRRCNPRVDPHARARSNKEPPSPHGLASSRAGEQGPPTAPTWQSPTEAGGWPSLYARMFGPAIGARPGTHGAAGCPPPGCRGVAPGCAGSEGGSPGWGKGRAGVWSGNQMNSCADVWGRVVSRPSPSTGAWPPLPRSPKRGQSLIT